MVSFNDFDIKKFLRKFGALRQSFTKIPQSILELEKSLKDGHVTPSPLSSLSTGDIQLLRYRKMI